MTVFHKPRAVLNICQNPDGSGGREVPAGFPHLPTGGKVRDRDLHVAKQEGNVSFPFS